MIVPGLDDLPIESYLDTISVRSLYLEFEAGSDGRIVQVQVGKIPNNGASSLSQLLSLLDSMLLKALSLSTFSAANCVNLVPIVP